MVGCSIVGCKSRSEQQIPGLTFHAFPTEPDVRSVWVLATGRSNWQPKGSSKVCSIHFEDGCFITSKRRKYLKPGTIPEKQIHMKEIPTDSSTASVQTTMKRTADYVLQERRQPKKACLEPEDFSSIPSTSQHAYYIEKKIMKSQCKENVNPNMKLASTKPQSCPITEKCDVKRQLRDVQLKLVRQKKISATRLNKLRASRESRRRLQKKVAVLENILVELKTKMLINTEESDTLLNIEVENKDFLKRYLQKENCPKKYSPALRKFALCLHFISPKAYLFVRKKFNTCLPHPKTLYKWYTCIDCEPGFTQESLNAIKILVNKSSAPIICNLCLDEMSIRQQLLWDGKKTVGYVNVGDHLDTDCQRVAKDALVFMVTAINGVWKLPVGYFLTNGVNGEQRSALVKSCISLLVECGVVVASLTFDGCPSNFAMAKTLGASFDDIDNLNTFINVAGQEIVIFPDPCHMLKLVRNTFAEKFNISNASSEVISWEYIIKLHQLQVSEGLHLGNKLRKTHVDFKKQIMKVRLAVQTLSTSVAKALLYCKQLQLEEFSNASPTAEFIEIFNNVFDILNSRKLFAYNFKKPISNDNFAQINSFIDKFVKYVKDLKVNDSSILRSGRKTGFLGLICCVDAIKNLYKKFISPPNAPLKYLCTYKMSQDHIEIFFGYIRSKGGYNNNPNVLQFMSAYKQLLIHGELKNIETGNCLTLEDVNILTINKNNYVRKINSTLIASTSLSNEDDALEENLGVIDVPESHDYLNNNQLSEFSKEITAYIAGFIVKKLKKEIKCGDCLCAILNIEPNFKSFIAFKDVGGLNYPSRNVIKLCDYTERQFRLLLKTHGPQFLANNQNLPKIILQIFKYFSKTNIFETLYDHIKEQDYLNNHLTLLIKTVALRYLEVRIHYVLKNVSNEVQKVRHQYSKLILFKGQ